MGVLRRTIAWAVGAVSPTLRHEIAQQLLRHKLLTDKTVVDRNLQLMVLAIERAIRRVPNEQFFALVDKEKEIYRKATGNLASKLLAIKVVNLLIAKREYVAGHIKTSARPIGFMVDPANQCQLGCPTCTNTFNREYSEANFKQWPRGVMKDPVFDSFLSDVGLYAFSGHFYNNHEPFLNKNTPKFVRAASDLHVKTLISSNLSFPKIDAVGIVKSGLQELMVAIDGVTQEVYEQYRKGGRVDWIFANVRALVEARRKLNSPTPYLRWQYLTFAHNVHEVPAAIRMAGELGFDRINLATPNDVSSDDPKIIAVTYGGPSAHHETIFSHPPAAHFTSNLEPVSQLIEDGLKESSLGRWLFETDGAPGKVGTQQRCDWLNLGVISDAMGRITPCCIGDYKSNGKGFFADYSDDRGNLMNSPDYQDARLQVANPAAYSRLGRTEKLRCEGCTSRPLPQIGLNSAASYMMSNPDLGSVGMRFLRDWSLHSEQPAKP